MAPDKPDPIAAARANWERAGWGEVAGGMVAVTSVMRAHQILLARVETALRPYDLSFSRFELLRLLAFSRNGELPITKASDRLQVHVTSVTHAIRRLESDGLTQRLPAQVAVVALDESQGEDRPPSAALCDRLGLWVDLSALSVRDTVQADHGMAQEVARARLRLSDVTVPDDRLSVPRADEVPALML